MIEQGLEPGMRLKDAEDIAIRYIEKHNLIAAFK
jgi:hypothetical protein